MSNSPTWNSTERKALKHLRGFMTARELAREVGVSKVNAYRIIEAIGAVRQLETKKVRQKRTGPLAIAFRLARRTVPVAGSLLPTT